MDEYSILRKKRKKNAFAATSLLISIALALLVLVGAVLILGKVDNKELSAPNDDSNITLGSGSDNACVGLTKEMVFNYNMNTIKEAAISYFTNERLPQTVGETVKITLKEMRDKKLLLDVIDGSNKLCADDKTYVEVTKEDNEYVMKVFLSCSDREDYILVHLGCYNYCESNICEKRVEKEYEYEYKKTTSCVMSPWSDWGNWKTTREKTSSLKKEDIKVETANKEIVETIDATKVETYNCDKYPGYTLVNDKCIKETTTVDTKDATPSEYSYNCDKYPGYSIVGKKCVKETTTTDIKGATKNPTTYNCDKYPGYTLEGTKCKKTTTKTETKDATVSYNCDKYPGYTLSGTKCVKSTTDTKDATVTYNCDKYPGYTLNGTKCVKSTTDTKDASVTYNCDKYPGYKLDGKKCVKETTVTKDAEAVYSTRVKTERYTCYKEECTTKTVFSCPTSDTCGDYEVTTCEKVKKTCTRQVNEEYISDYKCPDSTYTLTENKDGKKICTKTTTSKKDATAVYDCNKYSGYTLDGKKCTKTTTTKKDATAVYDCNKYSGYTLDGKVCKKTTTTKKDATKVYSCDSDFTLSGKVCKKTTTTTDTKNATKNPTTYNCDKYPDYTLDGNKCKKTTTTKDVKDATKVPGGYVCPDGYTQNDKTCTKTTTTKDTKNAASDVKYTCPDGYTKNNNKCTKKIKEGTKVTYYRYATRTCNGGSTSTKWSTSKNDSILTSDGYKLTGNKRELKVIEK